MLHSAMDIAPASERNQLLWEIRQLRIFITDEQDRACPDLLDDLQLDLAVAIYCLFHGGSLSQGYEAHSQGLIPKWIYSLA